METKMEKKKVRNTIIVIVLAFLLLVIAKQFDLFSTQTLELNQVQYYNKPIKLQITTDIIEPIFTAKFNNQNININYTKQDQVYIITTELEEIGLLKVYLNDELIETIEVKKPYVTALNNFPTIVDKGTTYTIEIEPINPQGEVLDSDSMDITIIFPDNKQSKMVLEEDGNIFKGTIQYTDSGNYIFKIKPRKIGYDTKETTAITSVLKTKSVHPVFYIWAGLIGLWVLLFITKLAINIRK